MSSSKGNEGTVQRKIWLSLGGLCCLFRLNTGRAWISNLGPKGVTKLTNGSVLINAPRSIGMGFTYPSGDVVTGACDLPGWTSVVVTEAMVGRRVAVFTSIEVKSSTGGRASAEQINWRDKVIADGGIAGIASSPEMARKIIDDYLQDMV